QVGIAVPAKLATAHVTRTSRIVADNAPARHITRIQVSKEPEPRAAASAETLAAVVKKPKNWRYIVGTFQIKIPVTTRDVMLFPEENTLAIMKWRLQQMAPANRWYPVLKRYISYLAARVDGLGGNSDSILPSPNGVPPRPG